jgi:glycerate 2-kinase
VRALACPASLKGVLGAREAAQLLAQGFAAGGAEADECPIADGGEGTADVLGARVLRRVEVHDAFGRPREAPVYGLAGRAVVESADAIPLDPSRLEVVSASSRGFGELVAAAAGECERLLVCLGGTATMDGGAGFLEVVDALPAPTTVLCDTRATLAEAPRAFGPQKGALADDVLRLEERFRSLDHAHSLAKLPGGGAAGGLGAALASLGAELVSGAEFVLGAIGFHERARASDLAVTGEGTVDRTTFDGKATGEAVRVCRELGVPWVLFGGRVDGALEATALSGDPARAHEDLVKLGRRLASV